MKTWRTYQAYASRGEWHIHTRHTDGRDGIPEYCQRAGELGIPLIAFTEHVGKTLRYDFDAFLTEIEDARDSFPLTILSGCEAKILPDGEIDAEEWVLEVVDYPIVSFHSFPRDVPLYVECLKSALQNRYVNAWAHPGAFLRANHLTIPADDLADIFAVMAQEEVALEVNRKYSTPPDEWIGPARRRGVAEIRGSDVHAVDQLRKWNGSEGALPPD